VLVTDIIKIEKQTTPVFSLIPVLKSFLNFEWRVELACAGQVDLGKEFKKIECQSNSVYEI